jgi:hypothetical protein
MIIKNFVQDAKGMWEKIQRTNSRKMALRAGRLENYVAFYPLDMEMIQNTRLDHFTLSGKYGNV